MIENLTLGQVGGVIALLVGIISGIGFLSQNTKKWIGAAMKEQMHEIDTKINSVNTKIDNLSERLSQVDIESCKNYLVTCLSDIERGKLFDEIEKERFWEQYEHYQKLGGNSYLKKKVEDFINKGWL